MALVYKEGRTTSYSAARRMQMDVASCDAKGLRFHDGPAGRLCVASIR